MGIQSGRGVAPGRIILRKEFREIFRDRRTVLSVIISPLLITPLIFTFMGSLIGAQVEKARTQVYHVGVMNTAAAPDLVTRLKQLPNLDLDSSIATEAEAEKRIKERKLSAVLVLPDDASALMGAGKVVPIRLLEDAGNETSQAATARLDATIGQLGQKIVAERLEAHHLPADYAHPFAVKEQPISSGGSSGTTILAMMLPYILVISAFSGAIYAAFDQVAGEKERGTLETLLVAPASRRDIVLGKFGAVVAVCLISSVLSVAGLILAFATNSRSMGALTQGGLHLSPMAIAVSLVVMLPLSILFAGVLLAVSTFARNQKEAQTYLAPLFLGVMMPAMASMFIGTDVSRGIALVPILGASIIIKQALNGSYDLVFIALAFAASAIYAGLALTFATRLFQKESVLIKA